ncbi:MAG: OmpA family protein [Paludibacteraceae bacterium]
MKKSFFLSVVVLASALTYTNAQNATTTPVEAAHWSVALKGGIDYFNIKPLGDDIMDNGSWGAGISIERTANPLVGYGLNVDFLNYNRSSIEGYTIDPTLFTSFNLSNLLYPSRRNAKVNVYANLGAGASIAQYDNADFGLLGYPASGSKISPLATSALALEANLSRVLALGLEAGYRGYISPESPYVHYNDAYTLMATLRFKLGTGANTHVRDMTRDDYYPAPLPVISENKYDDSQLINRLDNIDRQLQDVQNRLSKLEQDVKNLENMPKGTTVSASFENIEFDFDSDVIKEESKSTLNQVISILKENDTWSTIRIMGHTDNTGSDSYNQNLSERRAASVAKYLTENGIATSKISSEGFGESRPIATNDTAEGRQDNRRVEFEITK